MQWRKVGLWALMVLAVFGAGDHKQPGSGIALAILIGAHIIAKAIREK